MRRQSDPSLPGPSINRSEDDGLPRSEIVDEDGGADEQVHEMRDLTQGDARQEEKLMPLGLPAPNDRMGRWGRLDSFGLTTPRMLRVRTVKSILLLVKVRSLLRLARTTDSGGTLVFLEGIFDRKHLP